MLPAPEMGARGFSQWAESILRIVDLWVPGIKPKLPLQMHLEVSEDMGPTNITCDNKAVCKNTRRDRVYFVRLTT
jgi:hypothetical protein